MYDWLLYCMGRAQAQLTENTTKALFPLDFLFYTITIVAVCDAFCPTLCVANRIHWIEQFPLAIDLISTNTYWKDDIVRVRNTNCETITLYINLFLKIMLKSFFSDFRIFVSSEHTADGSPQRI